MCVASHATCPRLKRGDRRPSVRDGADPGENRQSFFAQLLVSFFSSQGGLSACARRLASCRLGLPCGVLFTCLCTEVHRSPHYLTFEYCAVVSGRPRRFGRASRREFRRPRPRRGARTGVGSGSPLTRNSYQLRTSIVLVARRRLSHKSATRTRYAFHGDGVPAASRRTRPQQRIPKGPVQLQSFARW